jgi:hypothetical protein
MAKETQEILQAASWVAGSLGLLFAGLSAFLAYLALRRNIAVFAADHDRSRKAQVLQLLLLWNDNVLKHRRAIEERFPGLLDIKRDFAGKVYLTEDHAREIYLSKPGSPDWDLRFHLIELVNFLEAIAVAYLWGAADRRILDESFRPTIINYSNALRNFVHAVQTCRGHDPWAPYTRLLKTWEQPALPPQPYVGLDRKVLGSPQTERAGVR